MQAAVAKAVDKPGTTAAIPTVVTASADTASAGSLTPAAEPRRSALQLPDATELSVQVATSLSLLQTLLQRQPASSGVLRSLTSAVDVLGSFVYEGGLLRAHKNAEANRATNAKQLLLSSFVTGVSQSRIALDE